MKLPSVVVSLLYILATALISAAIAFFSPGGQGANEVYAAIIVAALMAVGRYVQEQQQKSVVSGDGLVMRRERKASDPVKQALMG